MKTISEYIKSKFNSSIDEGIITKMRFKELSDFYNDEIPNDILEKFVNDEYIDYLYENLFTHDYKKLQDKIKQKYNDIEFVNYKDGSFYVISDKINLKNDESFLHLLEFYGYYISSCETEDNKEIIYIEGNETEDKTDYIYNDCHEIVYHICNKEDVDKILNTGLRCKNAKYRDYPKRIYVYASPKHLKDTRLKDLLKKLKSPFNREKAILKIDLRGLSHSRIRFMKDCAMKNDCAFFTYTNIPKEIITLASLV